MSAATPLLISVPSIELNSVKPWGSIFDAQRLLTAPLSHSLLQAVQLVLDHFGPRHAGVLCLARPEMFTHGMALQWLHERVHGAGTHLCISNGAAIKLVPGLRNEVFVYGLHRESGVRQYRALLRRAPEMLGCFDAQYNHAHLPQAPGQDRSVPTQQLPALRPYAHNGIRWFYPLYVNRHSHADSSERMMKWGSTTLPPLAGYERVVVVDCNDAALQDTHYCHALARRVAQAPQSPGTCLLLLLPDPEDPKCPIAERMARLHEGLMRARVALPRARLDNVQLCTALDEAEFLALKRPFELVLHELSPAWAYTHAFYAAASQVHLYQPRHSLCAPAQREPLARALLGLQPTVHAWTPDFVAQLGLHAN